MFYRSLGSVFISNPQLIEAIFTAPADPFDTGKSNTILRPTLGANSLLLAARDEEGQPMTEVELRDELMTLLLAGHETTATALTWAVYWIGQTPTIERKATR